MGKRDPDGPDYRAIRPGELVQLLNSTALGSVATDRSVRGHRQTAGHRVGNSRVDLIRYVGWMFERIHGQESGESRSVSRRGATAYDAHKERARARQAEASISGRDIGQMPKPENPKRREAALASLKVFYETYFSATFYLPWSEAHIKSIADTERTILRNEMLAEAMPRGWGKSSRFERAALWAGLKGARRFCVIIGSDEGAALEILDAIKSEMESNDRLAADFPEVCLPIRKLNRITQRARGQTYMGAPTFIAWEERKVVFPTIPGSPASGFIVRVSGLGGRVRGMKHARADGTTARPDLVLLDDPQTDDSAHSPAQVEKRLRLINGPVLRMAGPDQRIAAMCSLTVIAPDDLAARLIDRDQSPQWHGRRYETVSQFPRDPNSKTSKAKFDPGWWGLWQRYGEVRANGLRRDDDGKSANRFYRQHRTELEAGVAIAWKHKVEPGDKTAIQSAMNWLLDDPESFWAEGQNDPKPPETTEAAFDADDAMGKVLKIPRGVVPATATVMTAFVDVQLAYLPWMVCAWGDGFQGHIVDYGTWPDQQVAYFERRGAKRTIARAYPKKTRGEQLYLSLQSLSAELLSRSWRVETEGTNAAELSIDLMLVDAGYDTDTVVQFCRELRNPRVMPSRGDGLKPSDTPIPERTAKDGQKLGHHWMIHVPQKRAIRHVFFDTNRWKSRAAEGMSAERGAPGTITVCGGTRKTHRVLLDQLTAEYPVTTEARGRKLDLWYCRPNRDNDLWDCLIGNAVAGSVRGITAIGHGVARRPRPKRRRVTGPWART